MPPAGPLRAPLVEASRGPSPSAGTVSGAAAGCPAPLAPGRRPAAAREGWIGRRDGRQSLVPLAGIPVYALTKTMKNFKLAPRSRALPRHWERRRVARPVSRGKTACARAAAVGGWRLAAG